MLDRSKLQRKSAEANRQQDVSAGQQEFLRALDGLRLGYQQTAVLRLAEGTDYTMKGATQVDLIGVASVVWQLCQPLVPELRPYSNWVGSRDNGHTEKGLDLFVNWPNPAKQQELLKQTGQPNIADICAAFQAGLAVVEQRVQQVLSEVQGICEARAAAGGNFAAVMMLKPGMDFSYPPNHQEYGAGSALKAEWLGPAAARVFEALAAEAPVLHPRGKGHDAYYDIVVCW